MFRIELPPLSYGQTVGPLDRGPFYTRDGLFEGQWGMIPPGSETNVPKTKEGKRMSTNNARLERVHQAWTYRFAWQKGQRCLIPAENFDEPNWESGKNVWWTLAQASGEPWALAGIYGVWTDKQTGEVLHHYSMLTQNCDGHPLLARLHKSDPQLPPSQQDKRTLIPIAPADWETWLTGSVDQAREVIRLWPEDAFRAGPRSEILSASNSEAV